MNPTAAWGLVASALLVGTLATLLPLPRRRLAGWGLAALALFTVAPAVHGALGAPSCTLATLALLRLAGREQRFTGGWRPAGLVAAVAAIFYPLALGLGPFDPYNLGYRPAPLLAALALLGGGLAMRRLDGWLLLLAADLVAYAAGFFGNLWDALFDPLLVLLAALRLAAAVSGRWPRRSAGGS